MFAGKSLGAKYSADGYTPKKPVMIIPGLCSSCLKVVESPYEAWKGKRIWLSMSSIGFDKVWDLMFLGRKKKTNKGASGEAMADVDVDLKRRWIAHMCLADDGISDPEGIKLRPVKGLKGCKYLDPGALTDALSYVMGPVAEMLEDLGYVDGHNLDASPYDWRLPPYKLEERDGYFSELAKRIETMYNDSGEQKVVLIAHSLGNRVVHYFARFMEKKVGRWWFSKYVDNWLAIGPLWLGAPKLLRAMVTGDRMGLEAFLFPHEGIQLGRSLGSTAWMFPYICPSDHEFATYCKLNLNGKFVDKSNIEILSEGGARQVSQRYLDYYEGDPLYGKQEEMFNAPPVDKIYAIYGINLKTETFYFFKHSKSKKKITDFVLDSSGSMSNFKCEGGIAYETKNTRQNVLRGQKRGGDGTVPYPSLSFCKRWKGQVNVKIAEIEGAEHREILKNKTFLQLVLEYVAQAPPPSLLPVTFTDAEYKVKFDIKGRYLDRVLALDKQYIRIKQTSGKGEIRKYYSNISNIILDEDGGNSFFIEYEDSSKVATFQSEQSAAIVQDIAARCRYIAEAKASYTEDRNEYGQTALHTAAIQNDINTTINLLKGATDVNAVDLNGNTPLIVAAEKGSLDLMIVLLQAANIDVNKKANNSKTVIHHMCGLRVAQDNAAKEKWTQVMSVLKSNNVDVNAVAEFGETALHQACKRGNLDVTRWLLKNNAVVNATNAAGETPLHYAVRVGRKDLIELLLQNGADRHKDSPTAGTPLALAQKMDPTLMAFIRDFTGSGSAVNSPAATAARASKVEARKSLAGQAGRDEHGRTQLHLAASEDRLDRVFELLLSNANVNEEDKNGWTPLHCAASGNHLDVLTVLLNSYGVNVNAQTDSGSTVLHYLMRFPQELASSGNYVRVLQQIKQKGASLNLTATRGITPLHEAALRGNKVGATWLLDEGAKLNVGSSTGFTPLHLAVQGKSLDVVKLLIEHRGDHTQKSEAGTPVEMAKMVDPGIYSYLTSLPSSAPPPAAPARKKPAAQPFQTASHRRPTAPATPPSTEQESNGDEVDDDEDEVIYANDEDDDETVPGANTTVIPLAQRRRSTIYHIRERQSYSVIFTKPPIGETNNLLVPNIDQKSGPQSTRGRGPAPPARGLPAGRGTVQHTRGGTSNTGGAGNGVARGQKPVSRPLASSMGQSSSSSSNINSPSTSEPSTLTRSLSNDSPRGSPTVPVRGGSGSRRGTAPSRANGGPLPAANRGSPANRLSPAPGSGSTSPNIPGSPAQMKPLQTISPAQPKIVKGPPSQLPGLPPASNGSAPAPTGGPGTKFCMQCGTKRVPNFKFCGECGLKFDN